MSIEFSFTLDREDFSFNAQGSLPNSGVSTVIGRSGAGKTTLLRCLAGLEPKAIGFLKRNQDVWQNSKESVFVKPEKRSVGYVFQQGALFDHLTVYQNIEYAKKRTRDDSPFSYEEIVEATGVRDLLNRATTNLSGGERQRASIARALSSQPSLLLLDEPFSALDWEGRIELLKCLESLVAAFQLPIILVTHNLADAARLANYAVRMESGHITSEGDAFKILAESYDLSENRREPFAVLEVEPLKHHESDQLTEMTSRFGTILTPTRRCDLDTSEKITIWARDVGIALSKPVGTSLLNLLPAVVVDVSKFDESRMLVTLENNSEQIKSLVTLRSVRELGIKKNLNCFCLIKSVSFIL